jgi:hypothetical protein
MSDRDHDQSMLGPYVLGALEPGEAREVETHLRECAECREELAQLEEMKVLLGEVPPEAFLDGAPDDGDLMLQRTLRAARADDRPADRSKRRWMLPVAAAALVAATALGGGVIIGQQTATTVAPPEKDLPGTIHVTGTDDVTGTTMATSVEPRAGWSWVDVKLTGLEPGAECELLVTDENGKTYVAGSWVVSEEAARKGSRFAGGVLVPIDQVASVEVKTVEGKHVVTTPV